MSSEGMEEILAAREARWRLRKELSESCGKSVLSLSMTIPGPDKGGIAVSKAMEILADEVERVLGGILSHRTELEGADGPSVHWVADLPGRNLKRRVLLVEENHLLGRIADLDVLDESGEPVGRCDIGLNPRKCLICDRPAKECSYCRRHDLSELLEEVRRVLSGAGCM